MSLAGLTERAELLLLRLYRDWHTLLRRSAVVWLEQHGGAEYCWT